MTASEYQPLSWNGEPVTNAKLNQMCSNTQWLYDRMPRIRYTQSSLTRDMQVKVIAGKTPYTASNRNDAFVDISFGNFFTPGCHPSVTANLEPGGSYQRKGVVVQALGNARTELNHQGFTAAIWTNEIPTIEAGGWIHWQAIGY